MVFRKIFTSFKTLDKVTHVPGVEGREPYLVERIKFWRASCLTAGVLWGIFAFGNTLVDCTTVLADAQSKLKDFPALTRPYFLQFIYARAGIEMLMELCTVLAVYYLMQARWHQDNYKKSKKHSSAAWMVMVLGPSFCSMIPAAAFFNEQRFNRDTCANLVGMVSADPLASLAFASAASQAGEPGLAASMGRRPVLGSPDYESNPIVGWCEKHLSTWPERIFGDAWIKGTENSDSEPAVQIDFTIGVGKYPGVIPTLVRTLANLIGLGITGADKINCEKTDDTATTSTKKAVLLDLMPYLDDAKWYNISNGTRMEEWFALKHRAFEDKRSSRQHHGKSFFEESSRIMRSQGAVDGLGQVEFVHNATSTASFSRLARRKRSGSEQASLLSEDSHSEDVSKIDVLKIGTSVLCLTKKMAVSAFKAANLAGLLATQAVGLYCAVTQGIAPFTTILSVINGIWTGAMNVKLLLTNASIPGNMLFVATVMILAPILFLWVFLAQVMASVPVGLACMCFCATWVYELRFTQTMTKALSKEKLDKRAKDTSRKSMRLKIAGVCCIIVWVIILVRKSRTSIPVGGFDIDYKTIIKDKLHLKEIAPQILNFLFVSTLTKLFTTSLVLDSTLRGAGDDFEFAGQSSKEVIASYKVLRGDNKKKKKKKKEKKEKKYTKEEEEAWYAEEEAWYAEEGALYSEEGWEGETTEASGAETSGAESVATAAPGAPPPPSMAQAKAAPGAPPAT
eukprot:CAMPEP_0197657026 /NCGR_PEP_ID=MMETSP1338-20131121/44378_1 /TAXON_ID=43686 ORGANISM="Pelagodinium beii, Strain RCC1491" /NCGR_SAMPLE_ID=MMETSP1338 /ASSEMBLY_ACC=CAM_ASM_000754 /LENGTH=736 /DNA_ID=CAMNT_0043233309 /DNA_START=115 /DNA_END=2325 /DNA_ORIENTATION=-